jgi:hypothetical protein
MRRALAVLALLLALGAGQGARAESSGDWRAAHPGEGLVPRDGAALGALVWAHGYNRDGPPPAPPSWTAALAEAGWDLWTFGRSGPADPLEAGATRLAQGTTALRARGYRQVAVLGESRGAFIALVALRGTGLADAVVLAAPAAHGRSAERRPQALADFAAALDAARPDAVARLALVLFAEDGWDPDPARRASLFGAAVRRLGVPALLVDRPAAPVGHGGLWDPAFAGLAPCIAAFLDLDRPAPAACP